MSFQRDADAKKRAIAALAILKPVVATPDFGPFYRATLLAGQKGSEPERETAARYLASATDLDALPYGTFRYVTFANLIRFSQNASRWDKSIFQAMPNIRDCYWTHIASHPWSASIFKDLGDFHYSSFDAFHAWQAWDLGRSIDPDWEAGTIKAVAAFEQRCGPLCRRSFEGGIEGVKPRITVGRIR